MDTLSKKKRSELMSKIRSKNTQPEIIVRRYLRNKGYQYRLHDRKLPGSPDIVMKKHNLAVQVRGCFWHGHDCSIGHYPKSNKKEWRNKILKNVLIGKSFYFVHSFVGQTKNLNSTVAICNYFNIPIPAIVSINNIFGCQFHPEKSGDNGLAILKNFCEV